MRKGLLTGILLLCAGLTLAQGIPSEGREFYLGYLHPSFKDVVPTHSAQFHYTYAIVSSYTDNVVSVGYFDPLTKKEQPPENFAVKARQTTRIWLNTARMKMKNPGDMNGEFVACRVYAKKSISVQFFSTGPNAGGSYLALPVNTWGKKYVVASYTDNGIGAGGVTGGQGAVQLDNAGGYFMVIAAYDNTQVTITPTATTGGGHEGVYQAGNTFPPRAYAVSLQRGECYLVKSRSSQQNGSDDISSSLIRATKPIAVISGHEDAMTGNGSVDGRKIEARDFMVEQMIPVEYWTHTGYISLPMLDSPNNLGQGVGEDIRIYVPDSAFAESVAVQADDTVVYPTEPYRFAELYNQSQPLHFHSRDTNAKFMVMQYDLRNHGSAAPFPTPSMQTIVPRSLWSRAYLADAPLLGWEKFDAHYLTVIGLKNGATFNGKTANWYTDSIRVAINGSNIFTRINGLGSPVHTWNSIPGHDDLYARTYKIQSNRSYYIAAPFPFMVYQFSSKATTFDNKYGASSDDYYFSNVAPLGMTMRNPYVRSALSIKVDTICSHWRVCVHDGNGSLGGIRSITMLDGGTVVNGKQYKHYENVIFDPSDDPHALREVTYADAEADACCNVNIIDASKDASVALYVVDIHGNAKIVELFYKGGQYLFTELDGEKIVVPMPLLNEEICRTVSFKVSSTSLKSVEITSISLKSGTDPTIDLALSRQLPALIRSGDSLSFDVCFKSSDTLVHRDTILVETSCFMTKIPIIAQVGNPIISAEDKNFGVLKIETSRCQNITVRNLGALTVYLTGVAITGSGDFAFANNSFPRQIPGGQTVDFKLCYTPSGVGVDTAVVEWMFDLSDGSVSKVKRYSKVVGSASDFGLKWDRTEQTFYSMPGKEDKHRIYLYNDYSSTNMTSEIRISGLDADEFSISEFAYPYPPPYDGAVVTPGDSVWVDVTFRIDTTKPYPNRTRTATLQTSSLTEPDRMREVQLLGYYGVSSVKSDRAKHVASIRPNPARDRVTIDVDALTGSDVRITMYDVLGRNVLGEEFTAPDDGLNSFALKLPHLAAGIYTVTIEVDGKVEAAQLLLE